MQSFASSGILGGMDMGTAGAMGAMGAMRAMALESSSVTSSVASSTADHIAYASPAFTPGMTLTVTSDGKNYGSAVAELVGHAVTNVGLQEGCKRADTRRNYYTVTTGCEDGKQVIVPESVLKPTSPGSETGELQEAEEGELQEAEEGEETEEGELQEAEEGEEGELQEAEEGEEGELQEADEGELPEAEEGEETEEAELQEAEEGEEGELQEAEEGEEGELQEGEEGEEGELQEAEEAEGGSGDDAFEEAVGDTVDDSRAGAATDAVHEPQAAHDEGEGDVFGEAACVDDKQATEEEAAEEGRSGGESHVPLMTLEELQAAVDVGAGAIEAKRREICAAADVESRAAKKAYDAACDAIKRTCAAREAAELGPMAVLQSYKSQCLAFKHAVSRSQAETASHKRKRDEVEGELAAARLAGQTAQEESRALRDDNAALDAKNKRLKTINETYYQELKTIS
jgi:hypothetical protein